MSEKGDKNATIVFRNVLESEMERWFEHCGTVFHPVPASYFKAHWLNDPDRTMKGIFVAVDTANNNEIAATIRVFTRRIIVRGSEFSMGGIGEVSTKIQYQHRGLGSTLLKICKDYMVANKIESSTLSTSPETMPFYGRLGWVSVPLQFTKVKGIKASAQNSGPHGMHVEHVAREALSESDLKAMMALYNGFIRNFSGGFARSEAYWRSWIIGREMVNIFLVKSAENKLLGYFSLNEKEDGWHLQEFSAEGNSYKDGSFLPIIDFAIPVALGMLKLNDIDLRILTPVGKNVLKNQDRVEKSKVSFMYQLFEGSFTDPAKKALLQGLIDKPDDHVFWETDGF